MAGPPYDGLPDRHQLAQRRKFLVGDRTAFGQKSHEGGNRAAQRSLDEVGRQLPKQFVLGQFRPVPIHASDPLAAEVPFALQSLHGRQHRGTGLPTGRRHVVGDLADRNGMVIGDVAKDFEFRFA